MVEGTAELVALLSELGVIEYVSPSVTRMLGWGVDDLVGTNVLNLVHEDDLPAAMYAVYGNAMAPADGMLGQDDIGTANEYRLRHKDGHWVAAEVLGNNFLLTEGVNGLLIVGRDVTARHRLDEALTSLATKPVDLDGLAHLAELVDELLSGTATALLVGAVWVTPAESPVPRPAVDTGPWVEAMASGATVQEATDVDRYRAVWALPLADPASGEQLGCIVVWSELHDEPLLGWWATLRRISELAGMSLGRLRAEQVLQHAAAHDQLTGLLNRAGFLARVEGTRAAKPGALLLADLDGFKPVNDAHGHTVGDAVLTIAAQRLAAVVRPDDVIGRFGGDEFVVFLPGADVYVATLVAGRMLDALDEPINVGGRQVKLGVSIGIDSSETRTLDEQLSSADAALYRAKGHGRGRVEVAGH